MKIICQKNELAKYLSIATSIAPPKTAVSALTTLLLRTDPESQALIHDGVGDKYRAIVMPMRM